jgi:hypothetical protein
MICYYSWSISQVEILGGEFLLLECERVPEEVGVHEGWTPVTKSTILLGFVLHPKLSLDEICVGQPFSEKELISMEEQVNDDYSASFSWWSARHRRPYQSQWLQATLSGFSPYL